MFAKPIQGGEPFNGIPPVEIKMYDLVSYLVLQTSFITMAQFRSLQPVFVWLDKRSKHKENQ